MLEETPIHATTQQVWMIDDVRRGRSLNHSPFGRDIIPI